METKEIKRNLPEGQIRGVWQLKYSLTNPLGTQGFSGRMIGPYTHPVSGRVAQLVLPDNGVQVGFFIGDVIMNFYPEKNRRDAAIVDWLVAHPEVGIQNNQTKLADGFLSGKKSNPRITLVNLDHQDMTEIDNEEFIDLLVGTISLDTGSKAIGLEKLRFILSKLNLSYREAKFISDPAVEKKHLRKKLKTYIRKDIKNAKEVEQILDNMENAKKVYEIKELMRVGLLEKKGGMYFYEGNPLGSSYEFIIEFFNKNEEFYAEVTQKLYAILKSERS
jgi:hypothetical protein